MLSRVLGLTRDVLMAGTFGTSLVMSAFIVAFTIPNLFRRLFGEGALSAALVPVLVEIREKENDVAAWNFINRVFSLIAVVLTVITLLIMLSTAVIVVGNIKAMAILDLLRIMMPYMIFICLAAVSMGVLNAFHHFAVSAFAPCILNLFWIGTMLFVIPTLGHTPEERIRFVAWAVLLAGFFQWAVQWPMLRRLGWRPKFSNAWKTPRIRQMLLLMGPAALGMAVTQINVMIDRFLAIWVSAAAPSALFFSERIIYFPLGIIATALGTVLLPVFSGHATRDDPDSIRDGVTASLRYLLFIMIPASIGLLILARPIVQMMFEWKTFDLSSTQMTSIALQCYAPGLIVFSLAKIFVPAFYALQDMKTPVKIGICAVILNLTLNLVFILVLPQSIKHAGIAIATVLSEFFCMTCLVLILQRRIGRPDWSCVGNTVYRSLLAAVIMGTVVFLVYRSFSVDGKIEQIFSVLGSIAVGGGVYLIVTKALRLPEFNEFFDAMRRR